MRRLLAVLALSAASLSAASLWPSVAAAQAIDCAKPASRVEKAICDDAALTSLDRLVARALRFALEADPAGAEALRADQRRWVGARDAAYAPTNVLPLIRSHEVRLRELVTKGGRRAMAGAVAAATPIDPLREAGVTAEENAAFVAFVLTTLHPQPAAPKRADEGDVLSTYELYAGFTLMAPLPDGRLFVAVPEECGAYQCAAVPFALDRKAGIAARLAVEMPDQKDVPRRVPAAVTTGALTVSKDTVDVFDQGRGAGDCGTHLLYRVEADAMTLLKRVEKPECDGKEWSERTAKTKTYR